MNFKKKTRVIVIGAGLAGLSVADALLEMGADVTLIDKANPGAGASGTPAALLNPATGRRANMAWNASETVPFTLSLLDKVQQKSIQAFYERNGVMRPAADRKMAEKMKETFTETLWPDGWVNWFDDQQVQKTIPGIHNVDGGLMVNIGATIQTPLFLDQWIKLLIDKGLDWVSNKRIHSINELDSSGFNYDFAVWATGSSLTDSPDWKHIPFHNVKGQTITLRFQSSLNLPCSVSNLGYFAYLNSNPHSITIGSTYEHSFNYDEPDEKAASKLIQKFNKTFPEIKESSFEKKKWAGIRVNVPDRKPVVGMHPLHINHFVIGALSSKGLLHAPWLGMKLAGHIAGINTIPSEVSADRFSAS